MPIKMNSMLRRGARGWMSRSGGPKQSWQCGCKSLHRDPNLSRTRLMSMMKPEPGALVLALGATSSGLRLPWRQRSMTWRWAECHEGTWHRMSRVPWPFWMDLERFVLPDAPLSMSCRQIFVMRNMRSMTIQDQSQGGTRQGLDWFRPSWRVIALRPVLLYYTMKKLVAPNELWATTYIV
jgi:hypothetical protein